MYEMAGSVRRLYSTLSPRKVLAGLEERGLLKQCTRWSEVADLWALLRIWNSLVPRPYVNWSGNETRSGNSTTFTTSNT